ncbi:MAG: hypothetical protein ABR985_08265 [Methanotrichaceae archaeon]|jgi:hypothetical protein
MADKGDDREHGLRGPTWHRGLACGYIGEPISAFKEAVERETGILTEVDTYDWITFLPMSDGGGAYNCYTGIYVPLLKKNVKRGC